MNTPPLNSNEIEKLKLRIKELSAQRGITLNQALEESGAKKNFFSNLKNSKTIPYGKISQLALFFEVTPEYLLGKTNNQNAKIEISQKEKKIISAYRNNLQIKKIIDAALGLEEDSINESDLKSALESPIVLESIHN